jgi:hypothetical protein
MAIRQALLRSNFDSYFDSALPGQAAALRIKLVVTLIPLDPSTPWARARHNASFPIPSAPVPPSHLAPSLTNVKRGPVVDADGQPVLCRSWVASEWAEFTQRFKHTVENAWNNQMKFIPVELGGPKGTLSDGDFRRLIGNPKVAAHVDGVLEIDLQPSGAHALIEVAHVETQGASFAQRMTRVSDQCVQFGKQNFIAGAARGITGQTGQIAAAHEVGHWLRDPGQNLLPHIDQAYADTLPEDQRNEISYGRNLSNFYGMMGGGSLVTPYEARSWLSRLGEHTDLKTGWLFMHRINFNNAPDNISDHQKRILLANQFIPAILRQ